MGHWINLRRLEIIHNKKADGSDVNNYRGIYILVVTFGYYQPVFLQECNKRLELNSRTVNLASDQTAHVHSKY